MAQTIILVIGAADTGRAPLTAAMLRRRLAHYGAAVRVGSAGVLGHDDDPPTGEAIAAADQLGLDISAHRARSLTDELADGAALLIALDQGSARVARARFPAATRLHTLGELAGRPRDIPDPFKMQLGAWLSYAREIDELLQAAMPRIREVLPPAEMSETAHAEPQAASVSAERAAAATRVAELIQFAARMPGVVDWAAARREIEADLAQIGAAPTGPSDMAPAYTGLLRAALALTPAPPAPGKLAALAEATALLGAPVSTAALQAFSATLGGWAAL